MKKLSKTRKVLLTAVITTLIAVGLYVGYVQATPPPIPLTPIVTTPIVITPPPIVPIVPVPPTTIQTPSGATSTPGFGASGDWGCPGGS